MLKSNFLEATDFDEGGVRGGTEGGVPVIEGREPRGMADTTGGVMGGMELREPRGCIGGGGALALKDLGVSGGGEMGGGEMGGGEKGAGGMLVGGGVLDIDSARTSGASTAASLPLSRLPLLAPLSERRSSLENLRAGLMRPLDSGYLHGVIAVISFCSGASFNAIPSSGMFTTHWKISNFLGIMPVSKAYFIG